MKPLQIHASLLVCILGCASEGTSTGNGFAIGLLADEAATLESTDIGGTAFSIDEAKGYVRQIELDLPAGVSCADIENELTGDAICTSDPSILIEGPFVVDLVARTLSPTPDVGLPSLNYSRVDVRFDDGRVDEGLLEPGHPLEDLTLVAAGQFNYQSQSNRFDLALKFNEDARFERAGGVALGGEATQLMLLLDVSRWFENVDITRCLEQGDLSIDGGNLSIADSTGRCSEIENALKDAIKNSGQLDGQ